MKMLSDKVAEIQISYRPTKRKTFFIRNSEDAYNELRKWFPKETISLQERFIAVYLNRANSVLGAYLVSSGGITSTVADQRLIMSVALKIAAVGIILSHNHPSGNLKPSNADFIITKKIQDAGELLDIQVLDHIILTSDGYYSFADEGKL